MPNDIPYLGFILGKFGRSGPPAVLEAPAGEAEIEAFKASVLAKLALMVGKDGDAATARADHSRNGFTCRPRQPTIGVS